MLDLTESEIRVLREALDDEYKAWATCDQVIADFGPVRPFVNIREAEARHIDTLCRLFQRYGVSPQPNPWSGRVPHYQTLRDACLAGVEAELENGAIYERLISESHRSDIKRVLCSLRDASTQNHLPALRRHVRRLAGQKVLSGSAAGN